MNPRQHAGGLVLIALCFGRPAAAQRAYTSYETFVAWRALVPELHQARVCNLTAIGHELWSQGQLRLPAETFLRGDFRHTGSEDWAVPLADGDDDALCAYVLVTTRSGDRWQRLFLLTVPREDSASGFNLVWNEREQAIGLDFGSRRRVSAPARLVWQDGRVVEAHAGYVLDLILVSHIIQWEGETGHFAYRRAVPPEQWEADRPHNQR